MNILYLHGLDGDLAPEKRTVLQKYGKVFSPAIDYRNEYNSIELLVDQYKNEKIQTVIGSSLGGFVGYYISDAYKVPSLLFNPALASRSVSLRIPTYPNPFLGYKMIVLGIQDDVVDPRGTLNFLSKNLHPYTNYDIRVRQNLKHQINIDVFKEEVQSFFKGL